MWVGGVADSQTRSKPLKTPQNHLESRPFRPEFHLSFSQISQKPWGGWVGKQIWERSPKKKRFFFWQPPLTEWKRVKRRWNVYRNPPGSRPPPKRSRTLRAGCGSRPSWHCASYDLRRHLHAHSHNTWCGSCARPVSEMITAR